MKQRVSGYRIMGMQRDPNNAVLGHAGENNVRTVAYENMNMRVNALEEKEQFALVNERGTKRITDMGGVGRILGIPIGQNILDNTLTLFTTEIGTPINMDIIPDSHDPEIHEYEEADLKIDFDLKDRIYTFNIDRHSDSVEGRLLYEGNLNFQYSKPISTLSFYENQDIQKVYWTDGVNQPRVVNIAAAEEISELWNDEKFDFVRNLKFHEKVTIRKNNDISGLFSPGTIQYCMAYFDKYGQESALFYTSPIFYVTYEDRGTPVDENVSNSFTITIDNVDISFDYIRVYSIHRSQIDGTPSCNIVADLSIDASTKSWSYIPDGHTMTVSSLDDIYAEITGYGRIPITECPNPPEHEPFCEFSENSLSGIKRYKFRYEDVGAIHVVPDIITICPTYSDNYIVVEYNRYRSEMTVRYEPYDPYARVTGEKSFDALMRGNPRISFTDTGTTNTVADPFEVLFLGNMESITAETMEQKDSTLFVGNFNLNRKMLYDMPVKMHGVGDSGMTIGQVFTNQISDGMDMNGSFRYRNDDKFLDKWLSTGYYNTEFQLNKNEFEIKTFKSREWYRFGLQFQHKSGTWSEPLWLGDKYNPLHPDCDYVNPDSQVGLITAELDLDKLIEHNTTNPNDVIDTLLSNGFLRVRPVVVYPEPYERETLCQGYLCPTVYNYYDRYKGYCYAQSSWFARPVITLERYKGSDYIQEDNKQPNNPGYVNANHSIKGFNTGSPLEYRHNYPIPTHLSYSSEIQCVADGQEPFVEQDVNCDTFASEYKNRFAVDCSIVTLHTPDYESLYNQKLDDCKLRIIGMVPLTSFSGDINAIMETTGHVFYDTHWKLEDSSAWEEMNGKFKPGEFNRKHSLVNNLSLNGANIMASGPYYFDLFYSDNAEDQSDNIGLWMIRQPTSVNENLGDWQKNGNIAQIVEHYNGIRPFDPKAFIIYPWHRSNSFINQQSGDRWFAKPQSKKLSNLRYSYNTFYFDGQWEPERQLQDCQLFDSNENVITKLKAPVKGRVENVVYNGNVDTVIATDLQHDYSIVVQGSDYTNQEADMGILKYSSIVRHNDDQGYFSSEGWYNNKYVSKHMYSTDPIRMQYKSTPHVVLSLKGYSGITRNTIDTINILPYLGFGDLENGQKNNTGYYGYAPNANFDYTVKKLFYDKSVVRVNQEGIWNDSALNFDKIKVDHSEMPDPLLKNKLYGFLWLGELYRDNIENRFGGITQEALEGNKWVVCGEPVNLNYGITIKWTGGDTYYQRYDNLKTYPASMEDVNSIVDIVSFMCETRVNIDGRTDRNRGLRDNTVMTPQVFNLMNKAYTQNNNFFPIIYRDPSKINFDVFRNSVTWTLSKTAGDLIDKWTAITLASVLDFDGDKGPVNVLRKNNNILYAFQDRAVSVIKYNDSTALSTTQGTPIEIANSGKVSGKEYISETIGCKNKWACVNTQKSIYFIDDLNKEFYAIAGRDFVNLSEAKGFSTWMDDEVSQKNVWNPVGFGNFILYYDNQNHDVMLIERQRSLAYNETFDVFSSFYDYGSTPYVSDINGRQIMVRNTDGTMDYSLWFAREGEYNRFFNVNKDFYTKFLVNDIPDYNKIFDTVEFTADAYDDSIYIPNYTFNRLYVEDTYQTGESDLEFMENRPSSLKKKFRTWRTPVPRALNSKRLHDRMQDHWLFVKLQRKVGEDDNYRHILYNTNVFYYM